MKIFNLLIVTILTVITTFSSLCFADDVINGCYQKKNGQLRIVANSNDCNASEAPISWNKQGPSDVQEPGYVVRSVTSPDPNVPDRGMTGESYCLPGDYVTGCSYVLGGYPGNTTPSNYSFPVVQPIGCADNGVRVCTGCRVVMYGTEILAQQAELWTYSYCGRPHQ